MCYVCNLGFLDGHHKIQPSTLVAPPNCHRRFGHKSIATRRDNCEGQRDREHKRSCGRIEIGSRDINRLMKGCALQRTFPTGTSRPLSYGSVDLRWTRTVFSTVHRELQISEAGSWRGRSWHAAEKMGLHGTSPNEHLQDLERASTRLGAHPTGDYRAPRLSITAPVPRGAATPERVSGRPWAGRGLHVVSQQLRGGVSCSNQPLIDTMRGTSKISFVQPTTLPEEIIRRSRLEDGLSASAAQRVV